MVGVYPRVLQTALGDTSGPKKRRYTLENRAESTDGSVGLVHGKGQEGGRPVFFTIAVVPNLTRLDCCGRRNILVLANPVFSKRKILRRARMLNMMAM